MVTVIPLYHLYYQLLFYFYLKKNVILYDYDNYLILSLQYRNECEMLKASCEMNSPLTFLHHGACTEAELKTKLQGKMTTFQGRSTSIDLPHLKYYNLFPKNICFIF